MPQVRVRNVSKEYKLVAGVFSPELLKVEEKKLNKGDDDMLNSLNDQSISIRNKSTSKERRQPADYSGGMINHYMTASSSRLQSLRPLRGGKSSGALKIQDYTDSIHGKTPLKNMASQNTALSIHKVN